MGKLRKKATPENTDKPVDSVAEGAEGGRSEKVDIDANKGDVSRIKAKDMLENIIPKVQNMNFSMQEQKDYALGMLAIAKRRRKISSRQYEGARKYLLALMHKKAESVVARDVMNLLPGVSIQPGEELPVVGSVVGNPVVEYIIPAGTEADVVGEMHPREAQEAYGTTSTIPAGTTITLSPKWQFDSDNVEGGGNHIEDDGSERFKQGPDAEAVTDLVNMGESRGLVYYKGTVRLTEDEPVRIVMLPEEIDSGGSAPEAPIQARRRKRAADEVGKPPEYLEESDEDESGEVDQVVVEIGEAVTTPDGREGEVTQKLDSEDVSFVKIDFEGEGEGTGESSEEITDIMNSIGRKFAKGKVKPKVMAAAMKMVVADDYEYDFEGEGALDQGSEVSSESGEIGTIEEVIDVGDAMILQVNWKDNDSADEDEDEAEESEGKEEEPVLGQKSTVRKVLEENGLGSLADSLEVISAIRKAADIVKTQEPEEGPNSEKVSESDKAKSNESKTITQQESSFKDLKKKEDSIEFQKSPEKANAAEKIADSQSDKAQRAIDRIVEKVRGGQSMEDARADMENEMPEASDISVAAIRKAILQKKAADLSAVEEGTAKTQSELTKDVAEGANKSRQEGFNRAQNSEKDNISARRRKSAGGPDDGEGSMDPDKRMGEGNARFKGKHTNPLCKEDITNHSQKKEKVDMTGDAASNKVAALEYENRVLKNMVAAQRVLENAMAKGLVTVASDDEFEGMLRTVASLDDDGRYFIESIVKQASTRMQRTGRNFNGYIPPRHEARRGVTEDDGTSLDSPNFFEN